VTNPSSESVPDAGVGVVLSGDHTDTRGVRASQVHLSFASGATPDAFVAVPLTGTTARGGKIEGSFLLPGGSLPAGTTRVIVLRISVDPGTMLSAVTGSPLHVEADLDQVRLSDGSTTTRDSSTGDISIQTALGPVVDSLLGTADKLGLRDGG
jgi:hypothetical protein